ncbi:MFS transporter [Rouxiella badensis]|uniref:sugar efflux transporter n=1 Tax=Rouxiella badensis TaxID=1646377 RepID=UPI0013EF1391|nr:sugar efflux transporter [Rouxiella badensis]QII38511.1 MFS transporter [Rouxiella badensis]
MELQERAVGNSQIVNVAFMAVALILGVAGALQMPVVSLFLTRGTGASPMMVGIFYTVNAIASVGVSQVLARRSDAGGNRRLLILGCCTIAVLNALLFAFNRHYMTLLTLGVVMTSLATTAMPQLFALARQYADEAGCEVVKFSTRMRVQISLSWIIAPPVAFFTLAHFGFTALYLTVALLFALSIVLVLTLLPALHAAPVQAAKGAGMHRATKNRGVGCLFAALALLWGSDTMYLIDMPVYVSGMHGVAEGFAGWLLGGAAGFEILIMLFCTPLVTRFGKRPMMLVAALCAALFYTGMATVNSPLALVAIQLLNAAFIGIVGGIGMLYLQELLPGSPGTASTLYTNSIATGAIFAGLMQGAASEQFGHQAVYWLAMAVSLLALFLLLRVKDA